MLALFPPMQSSKPEEGSKAHTAKGGKGDSSHSLSSASTGKVEESSKSKAVEPRELDVLFGRGKPFQGFSGNLKLHELTDKLRNDFLMARPEGKREIVNEVVQTIKGRGGRFLRRTLNETWEETTDELARSKVAHILRGKPRKHQSQSEGAIAGGNKSHVASASATAARMPVQSPSAYATLPGAPPSMNAAAVGGSASLPGAAAHPIRQAALLQAQGLGPPSSIMYPPFAAAGFGPVGNMPGRYAYGLGGPPGRPFIPHSALLDPQLQRSLSLAMMEVELEELQAQERLAQLRRAAAMASAPAAAGWSHPGAYHPRSLGGGVAGSGYDSMEDIRLEVLRRRQERESNTNHQQQQGDSTGPGDDQRTNRSS